MEDISVGTVVALAGLAVGALFGATAHRTNFCTMGAISDMVFMGDLRRLRAWLLAIAVAILGTQTLHGAGLIDITRAIYLGTSLGWLGAILGGTLFGFGMTLAGGCGNKTLVRIGGGNLKSLVVFLVMGIVAYMTLRGLTGVLRAEVIEATNLDLGAAGLAGQGLADLVAMPLGLAVDDVRWGVAGLSAGALLLFCFKDPAFRASPANVAGGLIIGALVPAGWAVTGILGHDAFDPVPLASFTFVGPSGEALQYLMTFTGASVNFGIAAVGGVVAGAFASALAGRRFVLEAFVDASDMLRHLAGAVLMGFGGVVALGCTIGQGITGMSTLALGSLLALTSILAGGVFGMRYLAEGSLVGAAAAVLRRD